MDLGVLLRGHLGELSDPDAAMLTAYEADPSLAALRPDFEPALREFLEVFISGTLARAADG